MSYCQLLDYICTPCLDAENGRISAVAFVRRGLPVIDYSDPQTWKNIVCNDMGQVIPEVRGTYDGGVAVTNTGYGRVQTKRTSANHSVSYMHLFDQSNIAFYDALHKSITFDFFFATETKLWQAAAPVYVSASTPIAENVDSVVEFTVTVNWTNKLLARVWDLPTGIFENCETMQATLDCLVCQPLTNSPC